MMHTDTWKAIAEGAANSASHGDIESACDVLEHAAGVCDIDARILAGEAFESRYGPEERRVALQRTARELRAAVTELRKADTATNQEDDTMSATREHRNASMLEDACASIGTVITTFEHLHGALAHALPDDFPAVEREVHALVEAHAALQRRVVDHAPSEPYPDSDLGKIDLDLSGGGDPRDL